MKKAIKITSTKEWKDALKKLDIMMSKEEQLMTSEELEDIRVLGLAVQTYEESIYTIPPPSTIEGVIELRMYEMKLKQKDIAAKMGVSTVKLSLIMNGKQSPDVSFLKAAHEKLGIDAAFLLTHA